MPTVDGGLVAYPNPFMDDLTIHWHGVEKVKGCALKTPMADSSPFGCDDVLMALVMECIGLESGVYFIRAITNDSTHIVRVIK